jgi:putative ABC transport system permease protein
MKFLPYVLKHLRRNKVRTLLTVLAMAFCIFLFCVLQTSLEALNSGLKSANAARIVTRNRVSIIFGLPLSYKDKIKGMNGVSSVATSNWFGGFLGGGQPDFRKFFANFAVDVPEYIDMYPEYILTPEERQAFVADRRGAIVGKDTAERFGWKVGDAFSLESNIPIYRVGKPFDFVIRGIYKTDDAKYPGTDPRLVFFHYDYLYEATNHKSMAGTFVVKLDDPNAAASVGRAIDENFENSDRQTKTETEAAFRAGFLAMIGNLALLLNGIGVAVAFTILLVTANTMSMAIRERRTEIAVLKTLGFPSLLVLGLIMGEAVLIAVFGGGLGLGMSTLMIKALPSIPFVGDAFRGFPNLGLSPKVGTLGFGVAIVLGFAAGLVPALLAYRAKVTDMLRTA